MAFFSRSDHGPVTARSRPFCGPMGVEPVALQLPAAPRRPPSHKWSNIKWSNIKWSNPAECHGRSLAPSNPPRRSCRRRRAGRFDQMVWSNRRFDQMVESGNGRPPPVARRQGAPGKSPRRPARDSEKRYGRERRLKNWRPIGCGREGGRE